MVTIKKPYLVVFGLGLLWLLFMHRIAQESNQVSAPDPDKQEVFVPSKDAVPPPPQTNNSIPLRKLSKNGVPAGSFVYSGQGLPVIFPARPDPDQQVVVCVFERNPRQRSLFSTNMLSLFGSGKYTYQTLSATDCQHFGSCGSGEESNRHPSCPPGSPTVGLVEWIKCCFHDRFTSAITSPNQNWDVAIATGDEYCAATDRGRAHFRFYYRDNLE
ncbi:hypothetical protein BASA81_013251 [Batrachochytrium salamandrivorans]|nr:hypothetical protein BASA81_013251 [Batrachochytrium salamandrivorans]